MFNPSSDLTVMQKILMADATILSLLNLTGKTQLEISKKIIRESRWNDLATSERRLNLYFVPSRKMRNESFNSEVVEFDCHVPAGYGFFAYQVQERIYTLLQKQKVNNRYLYFEGQLGELPTMTGFFCAGSRFTFNRKI
jgi:hypothetical protein